MTDDLKHCDGDDNDDDDVKFLIDNIKLENMKIKMSDQERGELEMILSDFNTLWKSQSRSNHNCVSELYDISCSCCYEMFQWSESPKEWNKLRIPIQIPGTTETMCLKCIHSCCKDGLFRNPFTQRTVNEREILSLKPAECVTKILKKSYRSSLDLGKKPTIESIYQDLDNVKTILQKINIRFQELHTHHTLFKEEHVTFITREEAVSLKIVNSAFEMCNSMWDVVIDLEQLVRFKFLNAVFPGKNVTQIQLAVHRIFLFIQQLNATCTKLIRLYFCTEEAYNQKNFRMVRFCFAAQIIAVQIQDVFIGRLVAGGVVTVLVLTAGVIILCLLNPIAGAVLIGTGALVGIYAGYKVYQSFKNPIDIVADVKIETQNIPTVNEIYLEFTNLKMAVPAVSEYGLNVAQMKFIENLSK